MAGAKEPERILIMGAAGRDFHNFNMLYRDRPDVRVVAFTAAQIPGIAGRRYPPSLAGAHYPDGVPIEDEADLAAICEREGVGTVLFAYSDVTHDTVMHAGSRALAAGADFAIAGPDKTMLRSGKPVIAVSAVRTGCGKSQTSRWIAGRLADRGMTVGVLRHPMPYGDLARQAVQRFATEADMDAADCTIEEREEYAPHVAAGGVVFAGVDYQAILARAEAEADVILWDGGNNDFPFIRPDLHIVLVDALRPDQLTTHHPGEAVLRMADVVVVAKANAADPETVSGLHATVGAIRPEATIVDAASTVAFDNPDAVAGRRVLIVEDGPTITHGGMAHGAGYAAVSTLDVAAIVDPRASAAGSIVEVYRRYPHIGPVLPAMGYSDEQREALTRTIESSGADVVVAATPVDLARILGLSMPVVRVRYDYADRGDPRLGDIVDQWARARGVGSGPATAG